MSTREIQFRGMSGTGKKSRAPEWVFGSLVHNDLNAAFIFSDGFIYEIDNDDTLGQYTGMEDRRGENIFEGDVLANYTDQGPLYGVVVFDETHAGFGVSYDGKTPIEYETSFFGFDPCGCMEVIGNIHEKDTLEEIGEEAREALGI